MGIYSYVNCSQQAEDKRNDRTDFLPIRTPRDSGYEAILVRSVQRSLVDHTGKHQVTQEQRNAVREIFSHLRAANVQSIDRDDQIIMEHVRDALRLAETLLDINPPSGDI